MPIEQPLVSIVIPSYNHGNFVLDAVESSLAQTYRAIEVIVVDDGSKDDTTDRLACYVDRVRYIKQDNAGLSAARNTGIRAARGTLIAFLDADDAFHPSKLDFQVRVLARDPSLALVATGAFSDETKEWSEAKESSRTEVKRVSLEDLATKSRFAPSSVLVKRECFDKVGFFDVELRSAEDREMWIRIAAVYGAGIIPLPLTWYRQTAGSMSTDPERMEKFERLVIRRAFATPELSHKRVLCRKAMGLAEWAGAHRYYKQGRFGVCLHRLTASIRWWPVPLAPPDVTVHFARLRLFLAAARRSILGPGVDRESRGRRASRPFASIADASATDGS